MKYVVNVRIHIILYVCIKRNNEIARTKGKELDLAAPESNALFLMN